MTKTLQNAHQCRVAEPISPGNMGVARAGGYCGAVDA
jgi:hypothetical protein